MIPAELKKLPTTGKGSSRTVHDAGKTVIKRASGEQKRLQRGLAQNRTEYDLYANSTYDSLTILCPVIDISPDDETLVMKKALTPHRIMQGDELRDELRLLKRRLKYLDTALSDKKSKYHLGLPAIIKAAANKERADEMRKFFRSKMFHDLCVLIFDYKLMLGDVLRLSSWGYYRGRFVLIDYGLTRAVWDDHYVNRR